MIAFLHTLESNVEKFEILVRKYDKTIKTQHYVNEDILKEALKTGHTDSKAFYKQVENIRKDKPLLIICTCSTFGEESDKYPDVKRIDRPIVEHMLKQCNKIGLAYAASSTKAISLNLIKNTAQELSKNIEIIDINCTSCWKYCQNNEKIQYALSIAKIIQKHSQNVKTVFLAQASMEGANSYINDIDVLTSPEYGVKYYLENMS